MDENASKNVRVLKDFIDESKARIKAILERLNWTEENVLRSYNGNSEENFKPKEVWKEPPLPNSCTKLNSVTLAQTELQKLVKDETVQIPHTFADIQLNFSREQKLLIYEYVVDQTGKLTEPETPVPSLQDGQLSFAEIVAIKKREKKINRRKHRTSKPTHVEEVRNLVDLQMQALQQYLESKEKEERIYEDKFQNRQFQMSRHKSRETNSRSKEYSKYRSRREERNPEDKFKNKTFQMSRYESRYRHSSIEHNQYRGRHDSYENFKQQKHERSRECPSKRRSHSRSRSRCHSSDHKSSRSHKYAPNSSYKIKHHRSDDRTRRSSSRKKHKKHHSKEKHRHTSKKYKRDNRSRSAERHKSKHKNK